MGEKKDGKACLFRVQPAAEFFDPFSTGFSGPFGRNKLGKNYKSWKKIQITSQESPNNKVLLLSRVPSVSNWSEGIPRQCPRCHDNHIG